MNNVKSTKEINELIGSNKNVVIDFFATWCGPCKVLSPIIDDLEGEFNGTVAFAKFNAEEDEDEATTDLSIRNLPTVLFFKDGEIVDRMVGTLPKVQLKDKIKTVFGL